MKTLRMLCQSTSFVFNEKASKPCQIIDNGILYCCASPTDFYKVCNPVFGRKVEIAFTHHLKPTEDIMATREDTIKTVRNGRKNPKHQEGPVATAIEEQTAKLPSDLFLWLGVGSMIVSAAFQIAGQKKVSNFIGHWPVNFLVLGLYNKLVKLEGHE